MTGCIAFVEMSWIDAGLAHLRSVRKQVPDGSEAGLAYDAAIGRLRNVAEILATQIPNTPCDPDETKLRALCLHWALRVSLGGDEPPTN
jgi:hypothetical protein